MLAGSSFMSAESNTIRKSASLETVFAKSKSFAEEVAEAIYNRAGSLGNSHPSVFIGKHKKIIEGLMGIAEALRQADGQMTSDKDNCTAPTPYCPNQVNKQESANNFAHYVDSEGDFNKSTSRLNFPSSDVQGHSLGVSIQKRNSYKMAHKVSSSGDAPTTQPRLGVSTTPSCPQLTSGINISDNINKTFQETCAQNTPDEVIAETTTELHVRLLQENVHESDSLLVPVNAESLKNESTDICAPGVSSISFRTCPKEPPSVIHLRLAIDNANANAPFLSRPVGRSAPRRPPLGCFGVYPASQGTFPTTGPSRTRKSRSFFHVRRESVLSFIQPKSAKKSKSERKLHKEEEFSPFGSRDKVKSIGKQIRSALSDGRKTLRNAFSRLRSNLITTFKS